MSQVRRGIAGVLLGGVSRRGEMSKKGKALKRASHPKQGASSHLRPTKPCAN
jgi:hypothetical protein